MHDVGIIKESEFRKHRALRQVKNVSPITYLQHNVISIFFSLCFSFFSVWAVNFVEAGECEI